ncbi:hypothetical protein BJX63DRAFT_151256 [Aspergillus granulosus]|uniref:Uncharacterized protein n=1 Tax=Aspergillus granulosus TaxID=176169 RepID=A0ABR4GRS2_9EURO
MRVRVCRRAVTLLIQAGAFLCACHGFKSSPSALSRTVLAGFGDIIPCLLDAFVGPLRAHGDSKIPTPLQHAINAMRPDSVRMLLDDGQRLVNDSGLCVTAGRKTSGSLKCLLILGRRPDVLARGTVLCRDARPSRDGLEFRKVSQRNLIPLPALLKRSHHKANHISALSP